MHVAALFYYDRAVAVEFDLVLPVATIASQRLDGLAFHRLNKEKLSRRFLHY